MIFSTRVKILFLSPILPWPLVSGGQIRAFHLLKALSSKHSVTLVAYIRGEKEKDHLPRLKEICQDIFLIKRKYKPWTVSALFKTFFSTKPLVMNIYDIGTPLVKDIESFDLVYCECFYLMDKIPKNNIPVYLSEQNIEYKAYERYLENLPFLKKILLWFPMKIDIIKMKHWETEMWRQAKKVAVMSFSDKQVVEEKTGRSDVTIVPNGVDVSGFKSVVRAHGDKIILFVGNFSWFQNVQAVEYLVKEIYPKIKQKIPSARFLIVGKNAPLWLKNFCRDGIRLEENVEDIRDIYSKSSVLLAPLKSGGGTKYKILEAMASGIPVVTTPVGAEGLTSANEMIVRNSSDELAEATIEILEHPEKFREMSEKAKTMVETNFDWEIIGKDLEKFISEK